MRNKSNLFFILSIALVFVFQISAIKQEANWEGKTYKEQGVIIVENKGPGLWEKTPSKQIGFEEDLFIGEEIGKDYVMFRNKLDVTIDSGGNIYILDIGNHRILKFSEKGDFIWETGRSGQGPGEFQSRPSHYKYSIKLTPFENIAVRDDRSIHLFNQNSEYQKTLKLDRRIWDFDLLPDNRLIISLAQINKVGNSAAFYSSQGEFESNFPDEYLHRILKVNMGIVCGARYIVKLDRVFVSLPGPYEIREYDLEGVLQRKIKRDLKLESPFLKVMDGGSGGHDSNCSGPCYPLKSGMIVNLVTLVEVKGETSQNVGGRELKSPILDIQKFLDFFNEKGQFLGSYYLEDRELRFIDDDGFFYFSEVNPYPRIIRAKLQ